ncbi:hypothetical protein C9J48_08240 [Photobacterium profundum]|uniref:Uncharacterized protein n=1 Tax=Photobacterium profundum 3TCK TaxID=314280 RepID=Q1ZAW2_9GAMM|nr:hypothetical protein P3TCK_03366 [Photobacterium profundum 3TCK]PSV63430.1 hypothetical protein C9J48_08240 [Photobacterium profundum]
MIVGNRWFSAYCGFPHTLFRIDLRQEKTVLYLTLRIILGEVSVIMSQEKSFIGNHDQVDK